MSDIVKQRRRSLEGALREDSLWKATRINAFPRITVMDYATFIPVIAESREDSCEELRCTAKVELQRKTLGWFIAHALNVVRTSEMKIRKVT